MHTCHAHMPCASPTRALSRAHTAEARQPCKPPPPACSSASRHYSARSSRCRSPKLCRSVRSSCRRSRSSRRCSACSSRRRSACSSCQRPLKPPLARRCWLAPAAAARLSRHASHSMHSCTSLTLTAPRTHGLASHGRSVFSIARCERERARSVLHVHMNGI